MATNTCTVAHYTPIHYTLLVKNWTFGQKLDSVGLAGKDDDLWLRNRITQQFTN